MRFPSGKVLYITQSCPSKNIAWKLFLKSFFLEITALQHHFIMHSKFFSSSKVYACYTSLGEGDKMWYRCLVTKLYNSKSGLIMGWVLLIFYWIKNQMSKKKTSFSKDFHKKIFGIVDRSILPICIVYLIWKTYAYFIWGSCF